MSFRTSDLIVTATTHDGGGPLPPVKKPDRPLTAWRHRVPPENEKGVQSWI